MSEEPKEQKKENTQSMGFGITTETKESNNVRMLPPIKGANTAQFPNGYHFPIASLVNVIAQKDYETKNGKTEVLQFVFKDKEGRQHIRTEWAQDPNEEKYAKKMEAMNIRINHMYLQMYPTVPEGGIGTKATNFFEYFSAIAEAFKANPEIHKLRFYLKLVYFNNNLDFPYSPNFIEKVVKDKPCTLEVNLKYDKIVDTAPSNSNIPGIGASGGGEDIDFDSEY